MLQTLDYKTNEGASQGGVESDSMARHGMGRDANGEISVIPTSANY